MDKLRQTLGFTQDLPYTPDWSAAPDFLELISDHCLTYKPDNIVECSSGLSTLILARCCQINNQGHVLSLENGAEFADATTTSLAEFSVNDLATVMHTPLISTPIDATEFQWYDVSALPDTPIDMLVIDGPSGFIQSLSRFPALPLLYSYLAPRCSIFLDDAARDDEREIIKRWLATYPEFKYRYLATDRGCSILSRG